MAKYLPILVINHILITLISDTIMAKDPAFLFYPNDWLGGTLGMTFEEKGAYMELLMLQFNRGHMTFDMVGQVVGQLWVKISDKFIQDDAGLWYNERLDIEKEKRKAFTNSRKNNLSGNNQYSKDKGHMEGHMTTHMENENNTSSLHKDSNKPKSKIDPVVVEKFRNFNIWLSENCGRVQQMKTQVTLANFDKLVKSYTDDEIKDVLLSMENNSNLLKKYESVYLTIINWIKLSRKRTA